jgi:cell division transport system ATP-binding protein
MQKRVVELVHGRIIRDELEATYVTSSIKLPKPPASDQQEPRDSSVPLWARRGQQAPATGAQPVSEARPVTASQPIAGPATASQPIARPATAATPTAPPIWTRSETGPVLLPGEHAPWRATPVAPPVEEEHPDGRSLFFAAPVPAQRTETGAVPIAQTDPGLPDDTDAAADAGDLRGVARHTDAPLPDHLDFITGLGLRSRKGDDDDEVGPSS